MSYKDGSVFVVQEENHQQCDQCGRIEELRPYGPNGSCICFDCAMKDEAGTEKRFGRILDTVNSVRVAGGKGAE